MAIINWESGIFGMIPRDEWLSIPFTPPTIATDPIDTLFSNEKTDNIVAKWNSISYDQLIPSMAQYHAFDTEAKKTARPVLENHMVEKGLIKVKLNQSERLQALTRDGVRGDDAIYREVLNDAVRLARQVDTRVRVAKNELLATGAITIAENGLNANIDFGVTADQKAFTIDLAKTADIPAAIQAIIDAAREKGVILNGMVLSGRNMTKMRSNTAIQVANSGTQRSGALLSNSELRAYLSDEFGLTNIVVQDNIYNANNEQVGEDGKLIVTTRRYFPHEKITFFATQPNGRIGIGLYGDPPSVVNPMISANTNGVSPFVYIDQWTERDPAVLWTRASALFIPVLYNPSTLYIATATDTGA